MDFKVCSKCGKPIRPRIGEAVLVKEGDTVVDPFMGSGTTLYVAKKMARKAIGIELNEEYAAVARLRLSQQFLDQGLLELKERDAQPNLFPAETEDSGVPEPASEVVQGE